MVLENKSFPDIAFTAPDTSRKESTSYYRSLTDSEKKKIAPYESHVSALISFLGRSPYQSDHEDIERKILKTVSGENDGKEMPIILGTAAGWTLEREILAAAQTQFSSNLEDRKIRREIKDYIQKNRRYAFEQIANYLAQNFPEVPHMAPSTGEKLKNAFRNLTGNKAETKEKTVAEQYAEIIEKRLSE